MVFSDGLANETLLSHFHVQTINALGLEDYESGVIAAGALLKYLYETQMNSLDNILELHPYSIGKYMIIDSSSRRNLELVETLREKQREAHCFGYSTRHVRLWEQDCFAPMSSSLLSKRQR